MGMNPFHLFVHVPNQVLRLYQEGIVLKEYTISTGFLGVEDFGKNLKKSGNLLIRAKIGEALPMNTIFDGRKPTDEVYYPALAKQYPKRDWILTRVLLLSGTHHDVRADGKLNDDGKLDEEDGKLNEDALDSSDRLIYIHGCPDETLKNIPKSKGSIRMRNQDIIELFDRIPVGTRVQINE